MAGDILRLGTKTYVSLIDGNVFLPVDYPEAWEELDDGEIKEEEDDKEI
ncbi:MAG: hypothetical protein IJB92_01945 [Clostridia bacterium]|nr:hypothetical protein [Clostridia bacterium]